MRLIVLLLTLPLPTPLLADTTEKLNFYTNVGSGVSTVKLAANLYMPKSERKVAAMIIISSSSGVLDNIEGYYARSFVESGIAALAVDSFKPRRVSRTSSDQSLVTSWAMENDAFAALLVLKKDSRIDPDRIGVIGVSKGGTVAQNSAFTLRRGGRHTGTLAFALHVAIVPDCVTQQFRNAATTGAPLLYMLAELDDLTPSKPCLEYADRIRGSGNKNVEIKVYAGQHHGWEVIGPVIAAKDTENYSACAAMIDDNGDYTIKANNRSVGRWQAGAWMKQNCVTRGAHVGGGTQKQKQLATNDLIAFLKRNGF